MFGPETNRDKEQNTLSSVAFTILSLPKSNRQVKKKLHQQLSFCTQISTTSIKHWLRNINSLIDFSYIYFQLDLSHFCDKLLSQAHIIKYLKAVEREENLVWLPFSYNNWKFITQEDLMKVQEWSDGTCILTCLNVMLCTLAEEIQNLSISWNLMLMFRRL